MTVWDAQGTGEKLSLTVPRLNCRSWGHIVENRVITRALLAKVEAAPGHQLVTSGRAKHLHAAELLPHVVRAGRWRSA